MKIIVGKLLKRSVINNKDKKVSHIEIYLLLLMISLSALTLSAQSSLILTNEAMRSYELSDLNTAIVKLKQAIELDSSYTEARILLGQIYLETNQPKLMEEVLKPAVTLKIKYPEVHYGLGVAYFEQKKYKASLDELDIVLLLDSNNVQASEIAALCYLNLGVADYQNGLLNSAVTNFYKSIGMNYKDIQAYQNLAVVLYESGKREEAIQVGIKGLRISPKEKILLRILIQCYVETNKIEGALEPAKKLYKYYPNDVEAGLQLAYIYRYSNMGDEAFTIYKNLIKKYPSDQRIYDEYAELNTLRSKYNDAIDVYEQFLVHTSNKSDVYQKIAEIYLKDKKYISARTSYRNALKYAKNKELIYCQIADTYIAQNDSSNAIKTYNEGLDKQSESWKLNKELAKIYETINTDTSTIIYHRMQAIEPKNPFPSIRLATLYQKNNIKEAIIYCQTAIRLNAKTPEPYFILAELYLNQIDTSNSIIHFKQSVLKSLIEITALKKIFTDKLSKNSGRVRFNQFDDMEGEAINMDQLQCTLRSSLQYLLNIEHSTLFEDDLTNWFNDNSEEYILLEYLANTIENQNEYKRALSVYEQLIKAKPKNKAGHLGYARINEKFGKYTAAISAYKRAQTIDSKDPEVYHKLITLHITVDLVHQLCEEWLIRAKREPENRILLTNLRALLKDVGREEEYIQISELVKKLENSDL
jgi:tetratricopeptide (TPR) repeat protein